MELATFGSISITVALSVLGAEIIKKKVLDWLFPPVPPAFNSEAKKALYTIQNIVKNLPEKFPTLTEEEHKALLNLSRLHDKYDQDGVPLWYIPRSWNETQKETLNVAQEIAFAQKETAKALEGVSKILDKLADKMSDLMRK